MPTTITTQTSAAQGPSLSRCPYGCTSQDEHDEHGRHIGCDHEPTMHTDGAVSCKRCDEWLAVSK